MRRIIYLLFFIIYFNYTYAQGWDKFFYNFITSYYYSNGEIPQLFITDSNFIFIHQYRHFKETTNDLIFEKLDYQGNAIYSDTLLHEKGNYLRLNNRCVAFDNSTISIVIEDGKLSGKGFRFLELDLNGNILYDGSMLIHKDYLIRPKTLQKTKDGNYILSGTGDNFYNNITNRWQGFILKFHPELGVIWQRYFYSGEIWSTDCSFVIEEGSGYLGFINEKKVDIGLNNQTRVRKVLLNKNNGSTIENEYGPFNYYLIEKAILTSPNKYVFGGSMFNNTFYPNSTYYLREHDRKFNTTVGFLETPKNKLFINSKLNVNDTLSTHNKIYDVIKTKDENFVGLTTNRFFIPDSNKTIGGTYIFKFDSSLNIIWERFYWKPNVSYPTEYDYGWELSRLNEDSLGNLYLSGVVGPAGPVYTGSYWIRKLDANGCFSSTDCGLNFIKTSVKPHLSKTHGDLLIFPNPTNDYFKIQTNDKLEKIQVFTLTGNLVYEILNPQNSIVIKPTGFKNGVYIVRGLGKTKTYTKSLIISH